MRTVLADDQTYVRSALRLLLEQVLGHRIIGEADSAIALLTLVKVQIPDLVLLDWELPGLSAGHTNGVAATALNSTKTSMLHTLRGYCPDASIIVLSGYPEARKAALIAGANAFISKNDSPTQVLNAIRRSNGNLQP